MSIDELVLQITTRVKDLVQVKELESTLKKVNVQLVKLKYDADSFFTKMKAKNEMVAEAGRAIVERLKEQAKQTAKLTKEQKRFKAEYLSTMFGLMVINRATTRSLRGLLNTFNELTEGGTHPLRQSLTRLEANFKFLQFVMMDAAAPVISSLADGLAWFAQALAKIDPVILKDLVIALGVIAGLTTLGVVGSQMKLLADGLAIIFGAEATAVTADQIANVKSATKALRKLSEIGFFTVGFVMLVDSVRTLLDDPNNLKNQIIAVVKEAIGFSAFALGSAIAGGASVGAAVAGALQVGLIALSVGGAIVMSIQLIKAIGEFVKLSKEQKTDIIMKTVFPNHWAEGFLYVSAPLVIAWSIAKFIGLTNEASANTKGLQDKLNETLKLDEVGQKFDSLEPKIDTFNTTITQKLYPSLEGEKGLNKPLNTTNTILSNVNTNLSNNIDYLSQSINPLQNETEARLANADAINEQADAYFRLAHAIEEYKESLEELHEAAREGVAGG